MDLSNFKCLRCGRCCKWSGFVRLTKEETEKIAQFLGLEIEEFTGRYTVLSPSRTNLELKELPDGKCIFYRENSKGPECRINPVKPEQCTSFPRVWNFPGWEKTCEWGRRQTPSVPC